MRPSPPAGLGPDMQFFHQVQRPLPRPLQEGHSAVGVDAPQLPPHPSSGLRLLWLTCRLLHCVCCPSCAAACLPACLQSSFYRANLQFTVRECKLWKCWLVASQPDPGGAAAGQPTRAAALVTGPKGEVTVPCALAHTASPRTPCKARMRRGGPTVSHFEQACPSQTASPCPQAPATIPCSAYPADATPPALLLTWTCIRPFPPPPPAPPPPNLPLALQPPSLQVYDKPSGMDSDGVPADRAMLLGHIQVGGGMSPALSALPGGAEAGQCHASLVPDTRAQQGGVSVKVHVRFVFVAQLRLLPPSPSPSLPPSPLCAALGQPATRLLPPASCRPRAMACRASSTACLGTTAPTSLGMAPGGVYLLAAACWCCCHASTAEELLLVCVAMARQQERRAQGANGAAAARLANTSTYPTLPNPSTPSARAHTFTLRTGAACLHLSSSCAIADADGQCPMPQRRC